MTEENCRRIVNNYDMEIFSVLENHYMMNNCFLEEGQLLEEADRIAGILAFIHLPALPAGKGCTHRIPVYSTPMDSDWRIQMS